MTVKGSCILESWYTSRNWNQFEIWEDLEFEADAQYRWTGHTDSPKRTIKPYAACFERMSEIWRLNPELYPRNLKWIDSAHHFSILPSCYLYSLEFPLWLSVNECSRVSTIHSCSLAKTTLRTRYWTSTSRALPYLIFPCLLPYKSIRTLLAEWLLRPRESSIRTILREFDIPMPYHHRRTLQNFLTSQILALQADNTPHLVSHHVYREINLSISKQMRNLVCHWTWWACQESLTAMRVVSELTRGWARNSWHSMQPYKRLCMPQRLILTTDRYYDHFRPLGSQSSLTLEFLSCDELNISPLIHPNRALSLPHQDH